MTKHRASPVSLPFEPSVDRVRELFRASSLPVPSVAICEEVGEHLGTMARDLGRRLEAKELRDPAAPDHHSDFWKAMDLLSSALPGLNPLYDTVRTYPPGSKASVSGDEAFKTLQDALLVASRFIPCVVYDATSKEFDPAEYALRLFALWEHVFPPREPDYRTKLSPNGPVLRFIRQLLLFISGVEMTTGALYQCLLRAGRG